MKFSSTAYISGNHVRLILTNSHQEEITEIPLQLPNAVLIEKTAARLFTDYSDWSGFLRDSSALRERRFALLGVLDFGARCNEVAAVSRK